MNETYKDFSMESTGGFFCFVLVIYDKFITQSYSGAVFFDLHLFFYNLIFFFLFDDFIFFFFEGGTEDKRVKTSRVTHATHTRKN